MSVERKLRKGDCIYYNFRADNISTPVDPGVSKKLNIVLKTGEIIPKQSDYRMAIDFLSLRPSIPIFYCLIVEGITQTDINLTQYGVCFTSVGGNNYPQRLLYTPDAGPLTYGGSILNVKAPSQNGGVQDFSTTYYAIYTFSKFVEMTNIALNSAYVAFNAANPGIHASPPYFDYDGETGLFSFIFEESYRTNPNRATIYMNKQLEQYYEAIRVYLENPFGDPDFKDFRIITTAENAKPYYPPGVTIPATTIPPVAPASPYFRIITQEYDARYFWCNIKSIVFTSSSINTRPEYLPTAFNPNLVANANYQAFSPPTRSILAYFDIIIGTSGGADWRQNLYLQPAYRRWIDLDSDQPLTGINIEAYLQLTNGVLIPLTIPVNNSVDIKFVFQKK